MLEKILDILMQVSLSILVILVGLLVILMLIDVKENPCDYGYAAYRECLLSK